MLPIFQTILLSPFLGQKNKKIFSADERSRTLRNNADVTDYMASHTRRE
jgi:hypothetical protein